MVWQSHRVGRVCAAHAPAPHDDAGARRSGARRLVGTSRRGQPRPGGPSPPPPSRSLPRAPPRRPWYRHPTPKPPPSGRDAMRVTWRFVAAAADTAAVARPHARARGCRPCMERLMASQPAPARARGGRARVPRGGSGFPPSSAAGGWGAAPASHRRGLLPVHSPRRCAGASPPEGVWRQHPRGGGGVHGGPRCGGSPRKIRSGGAGVGPPPGAQRGGGGEAGRMRGGGGPPRVRAADAAAVAPAPGHPPNPPTKQLVHERAPRGGWGHRRARPRRPPRAERRRVCARRCHPPTANGEPTHTRRGPMAATKRAPRFLLSFAWRPPGVGPAPPLPAARGVAGCSRRGPPQTNPVRLRLARRRGSSG